MPADVCGLCRRLFCGLAFTLLRGQQIGHSLEPGQLRSPICQFPDFIIELTECLDFGQQCVTRRQHFFQRRRHAAELLRRVLNDQQHIAILAACGQTDGATQALMNADKPLRQIINRFLGLSARQLDVVAPRRQDTQHQLRQWRWRAQLGRHFRHDDGDFSGDRRWRQQRLLAFLYGQPDRRRGHATGNQTLPPDGSKGDQ